MLIAQVIEGFVKVAGWSHVPKGVVMSSKLRVKTSQKLSQSQITTTEQFLIISLLEACRAKKVNNGTSSAQFPKLNFSQITSHNEQTFCDIY